MQVEICTFGQYLRPSRKHMRVYDYVALEKYEFWKKEGEALVCNPLPIQAKRGNTFLRAFT